MPEPILNIPISVHPVISKAVKELIKEKTFKQISLGQYALQSCSHRALIIGRYFGIEPK